ncbi:glutamate 5-kinase, partial [Pseudomonadota bacterium]
AALVGNLVGAELVVLLTDQPGMYEADPRKNPNTPLISECKAGDPDLEKMASGGGVGSLGRGGMLTKVRAAEVAARSGAATLIAPGAEAGVLQKIASGEVVGTLLTPGEEPLAARKQWLAGHLQKRGRLVLDDGAVRVLCKGGASLLVVGVVSVEGDFERGEMVSCVAPDGREIACGLANYGADEVRKIAGCSSEKIESLLGYVDESELIHRDNLVLT